MKIFPKKGNKRNILIKYMVQISLQNKKKKSQLFGSTNVHKGKNKKATIIERGDKIKKLNNSFHMLLVEARKYFVNLIKIHKS